MPEPAPTPDPVDPLPIDPVPVEPTPVEPVPVEPVPVEPAPVPEVPAEGTFPGDNCEDGGPSYSKSRSAGVPAKPNQKASKVDRPKKLRW